MPAGRGRPCCAPGAGREGSPGPSASAVRAHERGTRAPQGSRVPQAAGRSARRMPGSAEPDWHGWAGCKSRAPRAQAGAGPGRGLTRRPQARVPAASWGGRLAAGPRPRAARPGADYNSQRSAARPSGGGRGNESGRPGSRLHLQAAA